MIFKYLINEDINVSKYLEGYHVGKSKIYKLLVEGHFSLNGVICNNNTELHKGDYLVFDDKEKIDYKPLNRNLDIVYEDDYLLILNKPSDTIIYDTKDNPIGLANMVSSYYKNNNINTSIKFPHRLDTDTTGIIVFCKDLLTHSYFNFHMANHSIIREYLALACGNFKNKKDTINKSITRNRHVSGKMIAGVGNDIAITHYEVLEKKKNVSLVKVILETGKTHQIRCHLASINHPLVGDELYDTRIPAGRVMLHSYHLVFVHPVTNKKMELYCQMPKDMLQFNNKR